MPEVLPGFHPPDLNWPAVLPVLTVILTGIVALCMEMARPKRSGLAIVLASVAGLGIAGYFAAAQFALPAGESFAGMVAMDRFGASMQILLLIACGVTLLFSEGYLSEKKIAFGEFYPLVLWSTSGAMLMVSTKNMLMVFLGLEILSIALYVLAGLSRNEARSEESALKYFLLGAFASGFLLYGIALLYGATGSLHFDAIGLAWDREVPAISGLMLMGLALALVGFSFKSAFVPFHQWTPDVYQGAPTNVTAFMAAGSKIAAVATLYRFLEACQPMQAFWGPALFWIAILTMTVGNLVALVQRDVKRILGYSSIAHAGYILVAILARFHPESQAGWGTLAFYLLSYSFMTMGAFAVITVATRAGRESTSLRDLNGLWTRNPWAALALVLFMVSLIGIPPSAGFLGKWLIFRDAVSVELWPLAIALAVNSAISVYYYLGIAMAAFVNDPANPDVPVSRDKTGLGIAVAVCAIGVLAGTLFYEPIRQGLTGPGGGLEEASIARSLPEGRSPSQPK